MRNKIFIFIGYTLLLQISCVTSAQQQTFEQTKVERKPFVKSSYEIRSPTVHLQRELRNGKSYDPEPKAVVIDEKTGKYEFHWIGTDGKEKIVAYQRKDSIEAIIEAKIEKGENNKLLYRYYFKMLPTSPTYFRMFIVQTIAPETIPIILDKNHFSVGEQSNANPMFANGVWWNFAFWGKKEERVWGDKTIEFQLASKSLPGIVDCRAVGGEVATKGVGEDIPANLVDEIPILEDAAWGYTIGPVESLSTLSKAEKAKYLLDNLAKFQEAGWMSEGTAKNYEAILKKEDLNGAFEKAKKDLENEFITMEVFQIIEGLNQ